MRIKNLLFLVAIMHPGLKSDVFGQTADLTGIQTEPKRIHVVKTGPVEYYLPPLIDSILLRRLAAEKEKAFTESIDAGFRKKEKDDVSLREHHNSLLLQEILTKTETSDQPDEKIIATLAPILDAYKRSGDIKNQSLIMNTYAVYYVKKGDNDKAIPYFQEALRLKELTKDKKAISKITVNLADVFKMMGRYDESIAYNEYTIRNSIDFKDRSQKADAYINIASIKTLQKKYGEAENYIIKKALPLFRSAGNKEGRMNCFVNLGDMYITQQKYSQAKWFYLQADLMTDILKDRETKVYCLMKLAEVKNAIGDNDLALEDYKKAEVIASDNNYTDKLTEIKGEIGEMYWKMGNYTAAGTALKEYTLLKDSILGIAQKPL